MDRGIESAAAGLALAAAIASLAVELRAQDRTTPATAPPASAAPSASASALPRIPDSIALGRRPPDPSARAVEASLADGMLERDRELHLGRGEVVSAALATDVRRELRAGETAATFDVDVDASGVVGAVHVVAATSQHAAWSRAAAVVASELAKHPLVGRFGPHGARISVRVELTQRYPSGHAVLFELIAFGVRFDVADFGAAKRRQLRAWIVGERALDANGQPLPPTHGEPRDR